MSAALSRRERSAVSLRSSGAARSTSTVAALGEVFIDPKAGGAFLAVDENAGAHGRMPRGRTSEAYRRRRKPAGLGPEPARSIKDNPSMVTKKPKGLGLGLEALARADRSRDTEAGSAAADGEPRTLALEQMQAGRYQPRTRMDEAGPERAGREHQGPRA
jgi:hypothetical protein